jgi:MSHA biogenesis protein MshJ
MMSLTLLYSMPEKYNSLLLRERLLLVLLVFSLIFFAWYLVWGSPIEKSIMAAKSKRENLLSISETIMAKYNFSEDSKAMDRSVAIIDKRISTVKSKVDFIDEDIKRFNEKTIAIGEIVLLLRDLLEANQQLSLESLNVYPVEIIKKRNSDNSSFEDAFEKNVISLSLTGNYASVFDYLKKIEALNWSVFWQDVKYSVESYPVAKVNIQLYTLSIIEDGGNAI